jgi:hypothetical protein
VEVREQSFGRLVADTAGALRLKKLEHETILLAAMLEHERVRSSLGLRKASEAAWSTKPALLI